MKVFVGQNYETYQTPLGTRYSTDGQMSFLLSTQHKFSTWRKIWVALAQAEKDLGLAAISQEQVDELKHHINNIDFQKADEYEKIMHHDVMAHIHAYGDQCPQARPIIHLGATSCLITDNAEIIIMREALGIVRKKLITLIQHLARNADEQKHVACLSYTHFQPAQPTTVGKRMAMWLQDVVLDVDELDHCFENLALLGIKGATGTQASFLKLFEGDHEKVIALEQLFAKYLGISKTVPISGQTYTRKQDIFVMNVLGNIAVSLHKMATDIRLLAHLEEIEEPSGDKQVGSSAMPYKKNPMLSERICSLSRYLISLIQNTHHTAANQWLERTLDDSANRRLCISEAFLLTDAILDIACDIVSKIVIHPMVIKENLTKALPFFATENILMACVKKSADRQIVHECIREHSRAISEQIKKGGDNNLLERLINDPRIPLTKEEVEEILCVEQFIGRAPEQVSEFLESTVKRLLCSNHVEGEHKTQKSHFETPNF